MMFPTTALRLLSVAAMVFSARGTESEICKSSPPNRRICLNMIVKNEERVLGRVIESVKDVIDYYVIVDTGSTDSTVDLIPREMKKYGIEGQVHQRKWVNFGVNRHQALELAMENCNSTWALFIDADDQLVFENATEILDSLDPTRSYELEKRSFNTRYPLRNLVNINATKQWRWEGVVHEYLDHNEDDLPDSHEFEIRKDMYIKVNIGEGARSLNVTQEQKYLNDAKLLEDDLAMNPDNTRSMYYLGQSYRDAGHYEKARDAFVKRVAMGGWAEEQFWSQFQVGEVTQILEPENEGKVISTYLHAYQMRPTRIEPLFALTKYLHERKDYAKAFLFASIGAKMPVPEDILFVSYETHQYLMLDELCTLAYYADKSDEGRWACSTLLQKADEFGFSPKAVNRYRENLAYYTQ